MQVSTSPENQDPSIFQLSSIHTFVGMATGERLSPLGSVVLTDCGRIHQHLTQPHAKRLHSLYRGSFATKRPRLVHLALLDSR